MANGSDRLSELSPLESEEPEKDPGSGSNPEGEGTDDAIEGLEYADDAEDQQGLGDPDPDSEIGNDDDSTIGPSDLRYPWKRVFRKVSGKFRLLTVCRLYPFKIQIQDFNFPSSLNYTLV